VETKTIDTLVDELKLPRLDYLKIDIEGAELSALHGGVNTLRDYGPSLGIEVHSFAVSYDKITDFLKEFGYEVLLREDKKQTAILYAKKKMLN
jgi:hypothetical protein